MKKLDLINRRAAYLSDTTAQTYSNLIGNYGKEKSILRNFAYFLDNLRFDKEAALIMFQEAGMEDHEDVSKKKQVGSSVVEKLERDETFSGVETRDTSRKEVILRNAIRTFPPVKVQQTIFSVFTVVSFAILAVCFGLSLSGSIQSGDEIPFSFEMCRPIPSVLGKYINLKSSNPAGILREIRTKQIIEAFYTEGYNVTQHEHYGVFLSQHKSRLELFNTFLQDVTNRAHAKDFSASMYSYFINASTLTLIPFASDVNVEGVLEFDMSYEKNESISEIIDNLESISKKVKSWTDTQYNSTLEDYSFMYLWLNKASATKAVTQFCKQAIDRSNQNILSNFNAFMIVYICLSGSYLLVFSGYLFLARFEMTKSVAILKIFKQELSKNIIGKIHHELASKNEEDVRTHLPKTTITKPGNWFVLFGTATILLIIICSGLMLLETKLNIDSANRTMMNVSNGSSLYSLIYEINFKIGEFVAFLGLNASPVNDELLVTSDEFKRYREDIKQLLQAIFLDWNSLLYGDGLTLEPSIAKYAKVDKIIKGENNCSALLGEDINDLSKVYEFCTGLEEMITIFATDSTVFNSQVFNKVFQEDKYHMFSVYLETYVYANFLSNKIYNFLEVFVSYSSAPSLVICIISLLVGLILLFMFSREMNSSLDSYVEQIMNLRW